jgi:hypothetical protein
MVVVGNDTRGTDVGLLARPEYPLRQIRTDIFDRDDTGPISRDCCEYHLDTPSGERLGSWPTISSPRATAPPGDPLGGQSRTRQAARVADIVTGLLAEGITHVAVAGDLNDDPSSQSLAPLLTSGTVTDVSEHPSFEWNHRRGAHCSGNEKDKIDYILLTDDLFARLRGGGVFRKGVWRGPRTKDPWEIFSAMKGPRARSLRPRRPQRRPRLVRAPTTSPAPRSIGRLSPGARAAIKAGGGDPLDPHFAMVRHSGSNARQPIVD